jgi:hypothetical protein
MDLWSDGRTDFDQLGMSYYELRRRNGEPVL